MYMHVAIFSKARFTIKMCKETPTSSWSFSFRSAQETVEIFYQSIVLWGELAAAFRVMVLRAANFYSVQNRTGTSQTIYSIGLLFT